jgi:hypothetical protein
MTEKNEGTPFVAIGNDELGGALLAGDLIDCERCGQKHEVVASTPPMLLFVRCGDKSYLVGIKDRLIAR